MNKIPDIAYVFGALVVVATLHFLTPSESTISMLTMIVGGIIGIATRHALGVNQTNVAGDATIKE